MTARLVANPKCYQKLVSKRSLVSQKMFNKNLIASSQNLCSFVYIRSEPDLNL